MYNMFFLFIKNNVALELEVLSSSDQIKKRKKKTAELTRVLKNFFLIFIFIIF